MGQVNISKNHHKLILVSLAILFIVMYAFIFRTKSSTTTRISSPQSETMSNEYTSTFLKFSFFVPSGFEVSENGNSIKIKKGANRIIIDKIYGYSNSTEEYLNLLKERNHLIITNNGEKRYGFDIYTIKYGDNKSDELIYIKSIGETSFISISTSSPELYDELDQIVASFEYLGDTKE